MRTQAVTLCCLTLLLACATADQVGGGSGIKATEPTVPSSQLAPLASSRAQPRQLLVSLANGHLVSLDQDTGDVLWTFDTGSPLVTSGRPSTPDVDLPLPKEGIFPGTDGSLYVYRPQPSGPPRIEKLPVGVPDLVEISPAPTPDGSLVLGSQQTSVFILDARRGALLRTLRGSEEEVSDLLANPEFFLNGGEGGKGDTAVLAIGRKDYVIRAVHPAFGEQWNVSWARLQRLSSLAVHRSGKSGVGAADGRKREEQLRLLVGSGHLLRRFDPENGWELWSKRFDAPPLAAYPETGGPVDLVGGTFPGTEETADTAARAASQRWANPWKSKLVDSKSSPTTAVAVGMMRGGLFGMEVPRGGGFFDGSEEQQCAAAGMMEDDGEVVCALNNPQSSTGKKFIPSVAPPDGVLPDLVSGGDEVPSTNGDASASALKGGKKKENSGAVVTKALAVRSDGGLLPWWRNGGLCASQDEAGNKCAVPLGMFRIEEQCTDSTLLYLPEGTGGGNVRGAAASDGGNAAQQQWGVIVTPVQGGAALVAVVVVIATVVGVGVVSKKKQRHVDEIAAAAAVAASPVKKAGKSKARRRQQAAGGGGSHSSSNHSSNTPAGAVTGAAESQQAEQAAVEAIGGEIGRRRHSTVVDGITLVGRLRVGPGIVGYGSGGTIVFEGELDGRQVAVKRLLRQFVDLAKKEIGALIVSDEHPNVVRCFAMEEDAEFIYLALERCPESLADAATGAKGRSRFVGKDGRPTAFAMQVAEDVGNGLAALHARGIVHRDLKPHNVLLSEAGRAKLSDMGLSKRLVPDHASFETVGAGGSPGWQAPEQLALRAGEGAARQTAAVDVFSFGLLVHFCLTGGKHPYGEGVERDAAILRGRRSLAAVEALPEAQDLLRALLEAAPEDRPSVEAAMAHPLWWTPARRLGFLIQVSDRVEGEDRAEDGRLYASLEALSPGVVGPEGSWAVPLDSRLVNNLGKYRRYDFSSLRDLLRVVRNKHSHFRELPSDLQARMGPLPDGFLAYFDTRFPQLLVSCFYFALKWCRDDPVFSKYFPTGAEGLLTTAAPPEIKDPEAEAAAIDAARTRLAEQQQRARIDALNSPGVGNGNGGNSNNSAHSPSPTVAPPLALIRDEASGTAVALFPRRPGLPPCDFFVKTGHCRFGEGCRFDHPPEYGVRLNARGLPLRPGQPMCQFFERNGDCKFGAACRFDHSTPQQQRQQAGAGSRPGSAANNGHYPR